MKSTLLAAVAALTLAACGGESGTPAPAAGDAAAPAETAAPAAPAATGMAPGPIAGEWEVTVTAMGMTVPATKVCYTRAMTMQEAQEMQQGAGITCSEQTVAPDGKSSHSVCSMQGMTITTDMKVTGDFSSAYTMDMTSTMDPAPPGMPPGPSTTSVAMKRLGDTCAPDTIKMPPQ
jgi:hypothetical protein